MAAAASKRMRLDAVAPLTAVAVVYQTNIWHGAGNPDPPDMKEVWRGKVEDIYYLLRRIGSCDFPSIPIGYGLPATETFCGRFHLHVILPTSPLPQEVHLMTVEQSPYNNYQFPSLLVKETVAAPGVYGEHRNPLDIAKEYQEEVRKRLVSLRRALAAQFLVPDVLPRDVYTHALAPYISYHRHRRSISHRRRASHSHYFY